MDFRRLRHFVVAAEESNFRRAALRRDDIKYVRISDEGAITPLLMTMRKHNNADETALFVSEFNRFRGKPR